VVVDYDVLDFGADITGITDATLSIQNAIDTCYKHGGGTVWLPAGTYKVTNTIYVKSFVTLRGDWRDPDSSGVGYGTVISAQVASGTSGPLLFQIGGSAGVMGVTVYYPNQNATTPVPYNYTFNLGGWAGQAGTYMAHNVMNCTMLNSYLGIGKCAINPNEITECSTFRNIKGTVLYRGIVAYNSADVNTWTHINLNNSYWANAGVTYNAPILSTLNTWTRTNGVAFTFADLEWDQFHDVNCSDYNIGVHFVAGVRIAFAGSFVYSRITNTNIAVKADALDSRWGVSFLRCTLSGSSASVQNGSGGYVKVADCSLTGGTSGNVQATAPGTTPASYTESTTLTKITRSVLYDVTKAPYNAPYSVPQTGLPSTDATSAIQSALNDAGNHGGGVVYLPAGWYRINTHLSVPANVELRGCSSVPQLDQADLSYGTTLIGYEGDNTPYSETDTALVTLNGNGCGINGLRFFYPTNNPATAVKPFPYTIRGKGTNLYALNLGFTGVWNALDFSSFDCNYHLLRNVSGTVYNHGLSVQASTMGWIENCLTNPAKVCRSQYGVPGWIPESDVFTKVINPVTRVYEKHIEINSCTAEKILSCFSYGANLGLWVHSGSVHAFNFGTDNVGFYTVRADCGNTGTAVMNLMHYSGTSFSGAVTVFNEMALSGNQNPSQSPAQITSALPPTTGTVGVLYSHVVTVSGAPAPFVSITGNPSWLKLNGYTLSGTPTSSGVFGPITVSAANSASCPITSQTFSITVTGSSTTPINELTEQEDFILYPNPTKGILTVELKISSINNTSIKLFNVLGMEMLTRESVNRKEILDVSRLSKGTYLLQIISNGKIFSRTVTLE